MASAGKRPGDRRREALERADANWYNARFPVSDSFPTEKYFAGADKVLVQFEEAYKERRLDDAYIFGKRFTAFSIDEIPRHKEYDNPKYSELRNKNDKDLKQVMKKLEQVTKWMDNEEKKTRKKPKLRKELFLEQEIASYNDMQASRSPCSRLHQWYHTPPAQATLLGMVFLLVFAAYLTIQAFAARTYGDVLASNTTVALYAVFTVACFASPAVTTKLGPRHALFLGIFGYAILVLTSLGYFMNWVGPAVVVTAGGINGIGSALLWNAQGILILQYSDRGRNGGTLFSIFWAFFNVSAIVGGLVSFLYFQDDNADHGLAALYVIFLCFILAGAVLSKLLLSPNALDFGVGEMDIEDPNAPVSIVSIEGVQELESSSWSSSSFWTKEGAQTLALFGTRRMLTLSVLFFYTGYKQPYQLVTFGDRYFDDKTLGLEVMMFYFVNMLGGIVTGRFLDGALSSNGSYNHSSVAIQCLCIFILITMIGNICAIYQEWSCKTAMDDALCVVALDYEQDSWQLLIPSVAYVCWGITDSVLQTYCYWFMGLFYDSQKEQSRAIGFYICVQSLGWCLGFLTIPSSRMKPMTQLSLTICNFVLGTVLAFRELPPPPRSQGKEEPTEKCKLIADKTSIRSYH